MYFQISYIFLSTIYLSIFELDTKETARIGSEFVQVDLGTFYSSQKQIVTSFKVSTDIGRPATTCFQTLRSYQELDIYLSSTRELFGMKTNNDRYRF
mmetsp:Transcript_12713/g.20555  ORF Transcript_12713/g.20555 Transcript_12713/m.20555 type:complete len:97 (+) Transcript_12713:451-741(+)